MREGERVGSLQNKVVGYSDQAHPVRDFTAAVDTSPAAYAKTVTGSSVVE